MRSTAAHEAVRSRRKSAGRRRLALAGLVLVVLIAVLAVALEIWGPPTHASPPPPLPLPGVGQPAKAGDPFAYVASREADFVAR